MISLNLEKLGVTEASLESAILDQLGLSREGAVKALAEKFGVELSSPQATGAMSSGATVLTTEGDATAQVLTTDELATLKKAASITNRIFS